MKSIFKHTFLFLVLFLSFPCFSQNYQGLVNIEGREFREQNDTLYIRFQVSIDSKAVPTCGTVVFEPEISLDNSKKKVSLPYIQLNGRTRANLNRRWFLLAGDAWLSNYQPPRFLVNVHEYTREEFSYAMEIPYEEWMEEARFSLKQEVIGCRAQSRLYVYSLANKVDMSARAPYDVQPLVAMSTPTDEAKVRTRQGSAFLDFQVGKSVILPEFRRNPVELGKINDAVSGIADDVDVNVTGMTVEGFASPEGSYRSNDRLSHNRALALKNYIRDNHAIADGLFTVANTPEDWAGLRILVEASSLEPKEELLRIISSEEEPDARERRLKRVARGVPYSKMLREIYPDLRRVEYRIEYSVRNYTTAEAREVLKHHPENLSQLEMYRVAEEYGKDSPEYREIVMETIPKYFPEDATANANAAALLIQNKEYQTARRLLERSGDTPTVWNNLGVVLLMLDELDEAEPLLRRASDSGIQEATHNLLELQRKREDNLKRAKRGSR